jgi:hypothetical protein
MPRLGHDDCGHYFFEQLFGAGSREAELQAARLLRTSAAARRGACASERARVTELALAKYSGWPSLEGDVDPKVVFQRVPIRDVMFVTSSADGAAGIGSGPYLTKSSCTVSENGCPSTCPVSDMTIRRTWSEESTHASLPSAISTPKPCALPLLPLVGVRGSAVTRVPSGCCRTNSIPPPESQAHQPRPAR